MAAFDHTLCDSVLGRGVGGGAAAFVGGSLEGDRRGTPRKAFSLGVHSGAALLEKDADADFLRDMIEVNSSRP